MNVETFPKLNHHINFGSVKSLAGMHAGKHFHKRPEELFFYSKVQNLDSAERLKGGSELHLIPLLSRSSELW